MEDVALSLPLGAGHTRIEAGHTRIEQVALGLQSCRRSRHQTSWTENAWRATADEDGHYSLAIPLCCRGLARDPAG